MDVGGLNLDWWGWAFRVCIHGERDQNPTITPIHAAATLPSTHTPSPRTQHPEPPPQVPKDGLPVHDAVLPAAAATALAAAPLAGTLAAAVAVAGALVEEEVGRQPVLERQPALVGRLFCWGARRRVAVWSVEEEEAAHHTHNTMIHTPIYPTHIHTHTPPSTHPRIYHTHHTQPTIHPQPTRPKTHPPRLGLRRGGLPRPGLRPKLGRAAQLVEAVLPG